MFASIGFLEIVLTASIPDNAVPVQAPGEPTNEYDFANIGLFPSDEDLAQLKLLSSSPFSGSDGVNIPSNIDVDELAAAAEHSSSTLTMTDSTHHNPTSKYPKPVCLIFLWSLCCHGKLYDRFGKISDCFECMILSLLLFTPCLSIQVACLFYQDVTVKFKPLRF